MLLNYAMQIPYDVHLYGARVSPTGTLLLLATFVWFVSGIYLYRRGSRAGYWVLFGYVAAQVAFYTLTEVVLAFVGYGLPYHLLRTADPIVWLAFVAGDLNYLAAVAFLVVLVMELPTHRWPGQPRREP